METGANVLYPIREIHDLRDMLNQSVSLFGNRTAFYLKNEKKEYYDVTYRNVLKDVNGLGEALLHLGLADQKIAVVGENSYKWATSYLAVVCGVGVVVPIDKELPLVEIENILNIADVKAIMLDKKTYNFISESKEIHSDILYICFDELTHEEKTKHTLFYDDVLEQGKEKHESGSEIYQNRTINPEEMSILIFTSGTTGMAKGVMLSHRNICSDISMLSGVVKIHPEDRLLSVLPLHHTYECTLGFLMPLYSGSSISYNEGLRYVMRNMQEVQPTIFVSVPLMLEKIHERIMKTVEKRKGGKRNLAIGKFLSRAGSAVGLNLQDTIFAEIRKNFGGKLRLVIAGAAAIKPEVARDFFSFGIPIYLGYGLTECSPLVIGNTDKVHLPDAVGLPLPGVEIKISHKDATGIGELCVRGPMVMLGYYKDPEETAKVLDKDGWFRTGDLGTVDRDGVYRITGRIKNVIVTKNGKNIYPEEVEYYLNKSPYVAESLVLGEGDDNDDITVTANIFPDVEAIKKKLKSSTPSKDDILDTIRDVINDVNKKLPSYKAIKDFDVRDMDFVKTTTHKIKRFEKDNQANSENEENEMENSKRKE